MLADATTRLRRLVEDVSLVSQAEEGRLPLDRHRIDLRDLVTTAVDAARPEAEAAHLSLKHELPEVPVPVDADPDRLAQVLANLLTNAVHHTPADGAITVTVTGDDHRAVVEITDTGDGISPDHLPHVFERFYRADPARRHTSGSGIGLTISRAIVQEHDGTLTATSPGEGHGASFTLQLPVVKR